MKPITVHRQPPQQRIEPCQGPRNTAAQFASAQPGAHVHHVNVRRPGTGEKRQQPIPSPRREVIEQEQPHRRALECEPAKIRLDPVQPGRKVFRIVIVERGVISMKKGPPDLLQPQASTRIAGPEASSSERRLVERKTEKESLNPTLREPHNEPAGSAAVNQAGGY